ncbi:myb-related transcription factor, partner of profilin-like [Peromyscus leucopus]|uniref:myb-related transcription factor, partner of profilin-like n=1 Tax=Peromyscus leucopus TaxID=10041 RepID=UPI0010A1A581|nr:myb-related transcription factor, partner of profilin-like [Peromyscus leucopus]
MLCGIFNPRNVLPLAERKRKPKFSKEELDILVTEVTHHEAVLFGRETMRLSHADRDKIWEGIARKVTSVSQVPRSIKDIKHRWDDMKRRTKDKLAFMQQSLSGPGIGGHTHPLMLTAHERAIKSALLTAQAGTASPGQHWMVSTAPLPATMKMRRLLGPPGSLFGCPHYILQKKRPTWPGPRCSVHLLPQTRPSCWDLSQRSCPIPRPRPRPAGPQSLIPAHPPWAWTGISSMPMPTRLKCSSSSARSW